MLSPKKTLSQQSSCPPPAGLNPCGADNFDVDLREALAATSVQELSFEEFHRVLAQQGKLKAS